MSTGIAPPTISEVSKASEPPVPSMEEDVDGEDATSSSWEVDYTMSVSLRDDMGSDIPLYNRRLLYKLEHLGGPPTFRVEDHDKFDDTKEDYWLFSVHVNAGEMFFLIGGENPALAKAVPNWRDVSETEDTKITLDETTTSDFRYSSTAEFQLHNERLVGVRAPKATNPAITVWGRGNYAALNWVGLFVKTSNEDTNQFIAVKTSKKLLPDYDDKRTLPKMRGTDLTGRSITLFPKQLFGTKGCNRETYDKFVTSDPSNKLGEEHWNSITAEARGIPEKYPSYAWNAYAETWIHGIGVQAPKGLGFPSKVESWFNYSKSSNMEFEVGDGLKMLVHMFGSILKGVLGLVRGDIVEAVDSFKDLIDDDFEKAEPDVKGMMSAMVKIGQIIWERKGEKKEINIAGVQDLARELHLTYKCFGCG